MPILENKKELLCEELNGDKKLFEIKSGFVKINSNKNNNFLINQKNYLIILFLFQENKILKIIFIFIKQIKIKI